MLALNGAVLSAFFIRIWSESGKKRRAVILLSTLTVVLVLAVGAYVVFKKGGGGAGTDISLRIIPENVDLQMKDIHFTEVGDENLTWEIHADNARFARKDNLAFFDRVRIKLIRADGKSFTLNGNEGRLRTDTKEVEVKGRVVVVSSNGDIVETDRLQYSHAERRIFTDQAVILKNPRMVISGVGMSLTLSDEKVSLQSGVKALIKTEKGAKGRKSK